MSTLDALPLFGATYDPERDLARLTAQRRRVFDAMAEGGWVDAPIVAGRIDRATGKSDRVASVDRQMRYVREWARESPGWTWQERDAGMGTKQFRLVPS